MKMSIVISVLNSHEIVRRQILHYQKLKLPDNLEIIFMDDGSDPPLDFPDHKLKNFVIHPTYDYRQWTWAIGRNYGARFAQGKYLLMTDIDYIISQKVIDEVIGFEGDKIQFKREFGVLDENGDFTQDTPTLLEYGLLPERIPKKGVTCPPHPNNFVMRKDLFFDMMGGYPEDRIGLNYPQGEDRWFKRKWTQLVKQGKVTVDEYRPMLYMFPNGQFCGDVDFNPFGLFHNLSRKGE